MKPFLTFNIASLLFCILLAGGYTGCSKKGSSSANNVQFSFNDSLQATCSIETHPNYDFIGGLNCEFEFDRAGQYATGESAEIGLFAGYHCEIMTAPLPYQTHVFGMAINVVPHPGQTLSYAYSKGTPDSTTNTPGDLTMTITERDNNRVRGTISGTIYRANVGQNLLPNKFDCTFDLAIPLDK